MMIHNASAVELCCLFPNSLQDFALSWLASLAPRSISGFQKLGQKFRHHFMAQRKPSRPPITYSQFGNSHKDSASLHRRFNKEAMKVPSLSDREHIQAYKHGLCSLSLTKMLATKWLLFVDNLLDVVHKLIKGEISV